MRVLTGRRGLAFGVIGGGVLAHVLDYVIAHPDGAERAQHLQATGHGYWPAAVGLAALSAIVAVALAIRRGAISARTPRPAPSFVVWRAAGSLAIWQVALFVVVEAAERAVVGVNPAVLLRSRDIWLGVMLQIAVAVAIAFALRLVEQASEAVLGAGRRRPTLRRSLQLLGTRLSSAMVSICVSPVGARAPPSFVSA